MKNVLKIVVTYFLLFSSQISEAQNQTNPVIWKFKVNKLDATTFEVHCTANIAAPWHIYSQHSPNGVTMPTTIQFAKNPLVKIQEKPKELGELLKEKDETTGLVLSYYNNKVDFVQIVKKKAKVKTNLSGTIDFMACNNVQCMPPASHSFSVILYAD